MKVILVFVREDSTLFPSSGRGIELAQAVRNFTLQNGWRWIQIAQDRELWIHHMEANPTGEEWKYMQRRLPNPQEIYAALHSSTMESLRADVQNEICQRFPSAKVSIALFAREGYVDIWRSFSDLVLKVVQNEPDASEELDRLADYIKKKPLARRLSILKHRLAHLFLPIDIDLQGLMERGFQEDYWAEVVKTYQGSEGILKQARALLYGGDQGEQDWVEKIVSDAIENASDNKRKAINKAWRQVQELLPNMKDGQDAPIPTISGWEQLDREQQEELHQLRNLYEKAKGVLERLDNRDQQAYKDLTDPFRQWFEELDEALDELRAALAAAQQGKEPEGGEGGGRT